MLELKYLDAARCYQQAAFLGQQMVELLPNTYEAVWAGWMNEAGVAFYDGGRYRQAEPLLEQALAVRREALDCWDEDLADSLNHLGLLSHVTRSAGFSNSRNASNAC